MKVLTILLKPSAGLCNMNCSYCFYREASKNRENIIMSEDTACVLIQKIKEYGPSALNVIFQGGEPLLAGLDFYKSFAEKLKAAVPCPTDFALQTNGLLIDNEFAKFFKDNNFLVGVSLDGDKNTNDRHRVFEDGGSTFRQVLDSISVLKEHNVDFNILSVTDDKNAADIERTYSFFKEQGFDFLQFIPCLNGAHGVSLSAEKYEAFLKKCFDLWYEDFKRGKYISVRHIDNYINIMLGNPPENCAMCGVCGSYFTVEANGDIYPCDFYCTEDFKLGSVFDSQPFAQSEKQRSFIAESGIIHEHCKDCKYHFLCRGGCKADRTDGFTKNRYCKAFYGFFEYAAERMAEIAKELGR